MKSAIPEQTLTNSNINSSFGISEDNFRFLEAFQNFIKSTTNSNNTVQPEMREVVSPCLHECIVTIVMGILEMQPHRSPWYDIQCLTCEQAADALGVETDTIRIRIKSGKMPASKIGNEWRIRRTDIDKMLKETANMVPMPDRRYNKKFKTKIS